MRKELEIFSLALDVMITTQKHSREKISRHHLVKALEDNKMFIDGILEREEGLSVDFHDSVMAMMEAYGQTETLTGEAELPEQSIRDLRKTLITEEVKEYLESEEESDLVGIAQELGDIMVVVMGCAIAYGIDLPKVLAQIQASNMSKIDPVTGKVEKREDGKVLKPEGYFYPDIESVI